MFSPKPGHSQLPFGVLAEPVDAKMRGGLLQLRPKSSQWLK
jgi:hypothetical protein